MAAVCTKHPKAFTLLFMITTVIALPSFKPSEGHHPPSLLFGAKLDLTHRNDHRPAGLPPMNRQELLAQMFARDQIRMMQRKLQQNKTNNNDKGNAAASAAAEMPLISGADSGAGEYFAQLEIGAARQKVLLVMDTASDLTWMNCNRGKIHSPAKLVFDAQNSTTFRLVGCNSSKVCPTDIEEVFRSLTWCSRENYCDYTYWYVSGEAEGDFAKETITFLQSDGKTKQVPNVLVGCTRSTQNLDAIINGTHGIMGLGYSKFSLPAQTSSAFGGGQMFSYCLVDHLSSSNVSSKLIFGPSKGSTPKTAGPMQTTAMLLGVVNEVSYGVKIRGIKIGGKMLNISRAVWEFNADNGTGGAIVDSGQTFTSLAAEAYGAVIDALIAPLLSSGFEKLNSSETPPFEHCYNTTARSGQNKSGATLPKFEIAFEDGAVLTPLEQSYWIEYAPGSGTKCLGFVNSTYAVIGNILQQNHLFQFDVDNRQLSFARSNCTY